MTSNFRIRTCLLVTLLTIGLVWTSEAMAKPQGDKFVFTTIWTAQAEFAGYYVAKEKGFYDEVGLDVEIQHPSLTASACNRLQDGECHAAMFSLMSAIDFISKGTPLVNIFQTSMNSSNLLISRWGKDPLKQKGIRVGIFNSNPNYDAMLLNYFEHMDYEWVRFTSHINLFLSGAVDATMAVSFNEYYQLLQAGFKMNEKNVFRFSEHGYNIQENGVYVKLDYFRTHQSEVQRFAKASRKGWEWAAQHPDETMQIVMKYVRANKSQTNSVLQKLMLHEVLRLQKDPDTGKRAFRVRRDMVEKASRMMLESGLINRPVTYQELMGLPSTNHQSPNTVK